MYVALRKPTNQRSLCSPSTTCYKVHAILKVGGCCNTRWHVFTASTMQYLISAPFFSILATTHITAFATHTHAGCACVCGMRSQFILLPVIYVLQSICVHYCLWKLSFCAWTERQKEIGKLCNCEKGEL